MGASGEGASIRHLHDRCRAGETPARLPPSPPHAPARAERCTQRRSGTRTVIAPGSIFAFSSLAFPRAPPSSSYSTLRSNSTRIFFAFVTWTNGDLAVEPMAVRATVRAQSPSPSAFVTPTSSRPSSGLALSKASMPPNSEPTFPSRTHVALPSYHSSPLTSIWALKGSCRRLFGRRPDVREAPEAVLQAAVGLANHVCVEPGAGHDREALAVDPADVQLSVERR